MSHLPVKFEWCRLRSFASPAEVFRVSLTLGLTSFGGPVAHLGYFEREYVEKRRWLSAHDYAGLLALCQWLPGPTSSQVGFLIGLRRAGWPGALAAWVGFTLPSALLMYGFARLAPGLHGALTQAAVHGLLLAAVAVVGQAVWNMGRALCPDGRRKVIGLLATSVLVLRDGPATQLLVLVAAAVAGGVLCRRIAQPSGSSMVVVGARSAFIALTLFAGLLVVLPIVARVDPHGPVALADVFYRSGALVFGGGHVVLPLLREALVPPGWVPDATFVAGYGLAQALPGPLFALAAYLGAASAPVPAAMPWAALSLVAIFMPGLLLATAASYLSTRIAPVGGVRGAFAGVNAAVVGLLAAALYDPLCTSSIHDRWDVLIAAVALGALMRLRVAPIVVVACCAGAGILRVVI